ncbi:hypothetical protein [Streptomyces sp. 6N223]|uniref:hypothetical protein n=1 Tax=Streptomyces sp. 6N223 TaxID=3457412 RepID=UPI003FD42166
MISRPATRTYFPRGGRRSGDDTEAELLDHIPGGDAAALVLPLMHEVDAVDRQIDRVG